MVRFRTGLAVALVAVALTACAGNDSPHASDAPKTATTQAGHEDEIKLVFNDEGIVVEPPFDRSERRWTREQAAAAIRRNAFFNTRTPRVWFGTFQGQPAWLAIETGLRVAPSLGPVQRGFHLAVFADGETPARALSGVVESGGDPEPVNVAPERHAYTGRIHVTFVTPSGGAIGGSLAKWMLEPAIGVHPKQSVEAAKRRSQSTSTYLSGDGRVYFGLFTGLDSAGAMHTRTPAWMVLATGYTSRIDGGPCCNHAPVTLQHPMPTFGAAAFADDLTRPWASAKLTASGHPLVY
jgi:hypothetical protein